MKPDISIAWAKKHIDCTPEGRKVCQGKCCTDHAPMGQGRYYPNEISKLPQHIKEQLEERNNQFYVVKENDSPCPLIKDCLEHPEWKPLQCKLWPFAFNKKGRVVMYRGVFNCPNFKKGNKTAFENCKNDLIDLFGKEWYESTLQLL